MAWMCLGSPLLMSQGRLRNRRESGWTHASYRGKGEEIACRKERFVCVVKFMATYVKKKRDIASYIYLSLSAQASLLLMFKLGRHSWFDDPRL